MASAPLQPASRAALITAFGLIYLVWGSTYLGIRVAVESMPPFAMASTRFLVAGLFLFALLRVRGMPWPSLAAWKECAIIGTFLLVGGNGLVSWAEQAVPSGIAALIIASGPLSTVLMEWAWPGGERPSALTFAGLASGVLGVAWLVAPWQTEGVDAVAPAGAVALLSACVLWSIGTIYSRRCRSLPRPLPAAALQMITGGLALGLVAAIRGEWQTLEVAAITPDSWFAFAYLVVAGSLVGFSTFAWLMEHSTPALVATYGYVNPAVAVLLGWLVLDEHLSPRLGLASVGIIASVVLISWGRRRPARA